MGRLDDAARVEPATREEWRAWLAAHHASASGVWFVTAKAGVRDRPRVAYEDAICEALCFGWVDGTLRRVDEDRTMLYFAPRKRGSTWAWTNKARVERLAAVGLMAPAGLAAVERAKADGSWSVLDAVEALEVPEDLATALGSDPAARAGYEALPASARKQLIWHVVSAKRPDTRARRVAAAVEWSRVGRLPRA